MKIAKETGFTLSEQMKMVKEHLSNSKPKQCVLAQEYYCILSFFFPTASCLFFFPPGL